MIGEIQEKTASIWNQLSVTIDYKRGPKQSERGVNKEDKPLAPSFVSLSYLPLKILLPDILNSSGLAEGEVARTQCEKCKPQ